MSEDKFLYPGSPVEVANNETISNISLKMFYYFNSVVSKMWESALKNWKNRELFHDTNKLFNAKFQYPSQTCVSCLNFSRLVVLEKRENSLKT